MSVSFSLKGCGFIDHEDRTEYFNLCNRNAADLLMWLGYDAYELCGTLDAHDLEVRCRRRLWDENRNHDPVLEGRDEQRPGECRVIEGGREPGYLRERTRWLLEMAERSIRENRPISYG